MGLMHLNKLLFNTSKVGENTKKHHALDQKSPQTSLEQKRIPALKHIGLIGPLKNPYFVRRKVL